MNDFKFSKTDKSQVNEVVASQQTIDEVGSVGDSKLSTVPKNTEVSVPGQFRGVNIEGLESIPASMVAVPFCRLIQPTSKKTELADGGEAPMGTFLFNDIQAAVPELNFVLLRAKHELKRVNTDGQFVPDDYTGETKTKPQVSILGITTDTDKLFVLSISSTSFSSFGKLIAKLKALQIDKTWRFAFKATSEKTENAKGKFYTVNFEIGRQLEPAQTKAMQKVAQEYGVVLDRQVYSEEE